MTKTAVKVSRREDDSNEDEDDDDKLHAVSKFVK